jgi:hypothetical protein
MQRHHAIDQAAIDISDLIIVPDYPASSVRPTKRGRMKNRMGNSHEAAADKRQYDEAQCCIISV